MYQVNKKMMESILLQKFLSPYTLFFLIVSFLADLAKRIRFLSKEKFNATTARKLAISKCYFYFMTHSCNFPLFFVTLCFMHFCLKLYALFSPKQTKIFKRHYQYFWSKTFKVYCVWKIYLVFWLSFPRLMELIFLCNPTLFAFTRNFCMSMT